jgi:WD40 repeat protein
MTAANNGATNPYVGPRPFRAGERLYGREREANHLVNLLLAERIVLLHSPSGAGKTSLIQAAVIPRLSALQLQVLPVIRVNLDRTEPSPDGASVNRYAFSTLMSLDEGRPDDQRTAPDPLANMRLAEYLAQWPRPVAGRDIEVLIFDQFEEVLILNPADIAAKADFFRQLGEALEDPRRWALFAMREDYVAALDPYVLPVPSRFANTCRLDLLNPDMARLAIQEPARRAGVTFEDDAAAQLVDDLRRVRVQQPDGTMAAQLGPHVEPMQLQVVCHRLWQAARPDPLHITAADIAALEGVDQSLVDESLASYYEQRVAQTAAETGTSERSIREWFDRKLITEGGVRGTVLMGKHRSGDLPNPAVRALIDAYLVRGEKRAGATWFELVHDRLIAPIRENNAAWFRANLSLLQTRADVWAQQGRAESLLLRGGELALAQRWARAHSPEVTPIEADFLAGSAEQEARALRLRRRNRIIAALGALAALLAVLAALAFQQAATQRDAAQRQARIARSGQLAAQSDAAVEDSPLLSMLLAVEAMSATHPTDVRPAAAEEALRASLEHSHGSLLGRLSGPIAAIAISPDGRRVAAGGADDTARAWTIDDAVRASAALSLPGHINHVTAVALRPDGRWLATGSKDGTIRLWDLGAGDTAADPVVLDNDAYDVFALAFSPDGRMLAAGGLGGSVRAWDVSDPRAAGAPAILNGHTATVFDLVFSPDGRWLATGSQDQTARVWSLQAAEPITGSTVLTGHVRLVSRVAFSPDGRTLATGSADGTARLWVLSAPDTVTAATILRGHSGAITDLAFSPDGRWLATGSHDATARLWDVRAANPAEDPLVLRGHELPVTSLDFSPEGRWLATGSRDKTIRVWNLHDADPAGNPLILRGHDLPVTAVAFGPAGEWLVSGSEDGTTRTWPVTSADPNVTPVVVRGHGDQVNTLAFSLDGRWLASAGGATDGTSSDNAVHLWDIRATDPTSGALTLSDHGNWIQVMAISPDGRWLATGSGDHTVRLWDLQAAGPTATPLVLPGHAGWISALAFSSDGRWLASGSQDATARVWDLRASDPAAAPLILGPHQDRVRALAFSPEGKRLVTAGGYAADIWDLNATGTATGSIRLSGHTDVINDLAISPDGRWLATAGNDGQLRAWDLNAGDPAASDQAREGHTAAIKVLAFSPDGRWLATGSDDATARLWRVGAGGIAAESTALPGHGQPITALAFSGDGTRLAGGGRDGVIRIWDVRAGEPAAAPVDLPGHDGDVTSLRFSPDGRRLASSGRDGTVRLWTVHSGELIAIACRSAARNFTTAEWDLLFPDEEFRQTCVG